MQNWPGNGVTHSFDFCRIFQGLAPGETATVSAWVLYEYNGEIIWDEEYWFKIVVGGGPINVDVLQKSTGLANVAFVRHIRPPDQTRPETPDGAFPWYLNDFGYDPFYYRINMGYHPPGLQAANAFKAHAEWTQPASVKIRYQLTNKGVFVNADPDLEVLGDGRNPRLTKPFEGTKNALISWDGQTGNEGDTVLTGTYYYIAEDGMETALCDDHTPQYRVTNPPLLPDNSPISFPEQYCTFHSHRPTSLAAYTYAINPSTPNNPHLYQLLDANGEGMPGVWVQERFWFYVPDDAWTNDQFLLGYLWTTQRKGYAGGSFVTAPYNVHGVFDTPDYLSYHDPLVLDGHEYFAATNLGARRENGTPYPERQMYPGSQTWVYKGVFIGCFIITINPPNGDQSPTSQKSDSSKNGG
ncbi:MAG: hypothetical protein U0R49_01330 [Fimbriimonadales bacterium]